MQRRRKRLPPDTRPRWDDPNLKVIMSRDNAQGIPSEFLSELCQINMALGEKPKWRGDPTYNLKKSPRVKD